MSAAQEVITPREASLAIELRDALTKAKDLGEELAAEKIRAAKLEAQLASPAPAVALPERKRESRAWGHDMGGNYDEGYADGWNRGLDEVAHLNPAAAQVPDVDALVSRFLAWPLPDSVCVDGCATTPAYPHRHGTNLLNADEARSMLSFVLGAPVPPVQPAEQVPVAWVYPSQLRALASADGSATCAVWNKCFGPLAPLYTSPPAAPAQDVAGLVGALESALMAIIGYKHQNAITLAAVSKARAALAAYKGDAK